MKDVTIVGAGTAGLILAADLARRGIGVTVYDSGKSPGEHAVKASGLLSKEGLERIGIDYKGALVNSITGAILHANKESMKVTAKSTKAYVLDRVKLAEMLSEQAKKEGAHVKFGKRLGKEDLLSMDDQIIIGADGSVSTVASAFGFPEMKERMLTYKAEYHLKNRIDPTHVGLFFDRSAFRLFGWTIPYSDSVLEVGIGTSGRQRSNSRKQFDLFVDGNLAEVLEGSRLLAGHASTIPVAPRKVTVKGNVALVGDAAGQVKATTGGGIIFGSLCARVLADCVADSVKEGKSLKAYEAKWRKLYGKELYMHSIVHELYSKMGTSGIAGSIKLAKLFGFDSFLGEYGDMDRPSLMVKRFFLRSLSK